jgi:hypothetical protein
MSDDGAALAQQLEWEAAQRPRVAAASVAAGVLMIGGSIYTTAGLTTPSVGVVQGLAPALMGIPDPTVDPRTGEILFTAHHSARIIAASLITAIGIAVIGFVLWYLYKAVRARRPVPDLPRILAVAGPLLVAAAGVATAIVLTINAHHFVNGASRSMKAADHALGSGAVVAVQVVGLVGELSLAFALVMIGLNAMRAGLVTRFMGVLAIISGVLFVIPLLGAGLPVVQAFWLIALGVVLSGRAPTGLPPAWTTGVATPWPTQQQMRQARGRQRGGVVEEAAPEPVAPPPRDSRRRKRKRR